MIVLPLLCVPDARQSAGAVGRLRLIHVHRADHWRAAIIDALTNSIPPHLYIGPNEVAYVHSFTLQYTSSISSCRIEL